MPKYSYIAKTRDAKTVKGVVDVDSRADLVTRLKSKGFFIVSIKEVEERTQKASFFYSLLHRRGKRSSIKLQDLTFFARNLSTTLSSGVTLLRSLEIIAYQAESAKLEKILNKCCEGIKGGLSFGEVIAKYPKVFSSLWQGIIHVGEHSGNLPFVLDKLADYLELRMEFERKIKSALIYPSILVVVAAVAVTIFLKFILPKFTIIFRQFDIELPLPTQIVFTISEFFSNNFLLVIGGGVLVVFLSYFLKDKPFVKQFWDRICFKVPILGQIMFSFFLERVTSTIYILIDSGLPLVYALEITANSVGNSVLRESILFVKERVREGASLSEELRKIHFFPLLVSEMAKIGEETGTIADVFSKISTHYRKELTTKIERLIAAFEPLMVIFMGIVIGGIVISLFLPLFRLVTLGGGT